MTTFVIIILAIAGTVWAIKGLKEHIADEVQNRVDDELDRRERMRPETEEERMDRIIEMDHEMHMLNRSINPEFYKTLDEKVAEEEAKRRAKSVN